MKFKKSIFVLFVLMFFSDFCFSKNFEKIVNVCFVSSNLGGELPSAMDDNNRLGSFKMVFDDFNRNNKNLKINFKSNFNRLSIFESLDWAIKSDCSIYLGLISSRDALIAGEVLKNSNIIGISSTASSFNINKFYPKLLSFTYSAEQNSADLIRYLNSVKGKKVFIIGKKDDVYSSNFLPFFENSNFKNKFIYLDGKGELSNVDLEMLNNLKEPFVLVYTTYPVVSLPSIKSLSVFLNNSKKMSIIGVHSWMEKHVFSSYLDVFQKFGKVDVMNGWDFSHKNKAALSFIEKYKKIFGLYPNHDAFYDYDVAVFVTKCLKAVRDLSRISSCVNNVTPYQGLTANVFFNGKSFVNRQRNYVHSFIDVLNL